MDDISIITTASSKKFRGNDKINVNDGNDCEEEEKDRCMIDTKNAENNGQSSEKSIPPLKFMLNKTSVVVRSKESEETNDNSISCTDEPLSTLIPDNYCRIPNSSFINGTLVVNQSPFGMNSEAAHNRSKHRNSTNPPTDNKPKETLKFTLTKNNQTKVSNVNADSSSKDLLIDQKQKQLTRDQSVSSFDSEKIAEFNEVKLPTSTPRGLSNYLTKTLSKPITEKLLKEVDKDHATIQYNVITDLTEEVNAAKTNCQGLNRYAINPALFAEKKHENVGNLLIQTTKGRLELYDIQKSDLISSAF